MSTKQTNGYNPDHSLLSLFPFKHLMPHHLTDAGRNEAMLLIEGIHPQEVETEPGLFEKKPVLKFQKTELGYVLANRPRYPGAHGRVRHPQHRRRIGQDHHYCPHR